MSLPPFCINFNEVDNRLMGTVLPNEEDAFIVYDCCLFYFQFITLHSQKQVPHLSAFALIPPPPPPLLCIHYE